MIVVKIELHSAIHPSRSKEIGRMVISNDGTGTDELGSYNVELMRRGTKDKVLRQGLIQNYPRHAYTVWELVRRALQVTLGKHPVHPGTAEEFDEQVKEP